MMMMMEILMTKEPYSMVQAAKTVLTHDGYQVIVEFRENMDFSGKLMDALDIIRYVRESFGHDTTIMIIAGGPEN
ncbi:MAG: hypothetical protein R3D00_19935 [Bacteroidia bacterium]